MRGNDGLEFRSECEQSGMRAAIKRCTQLNETAVAGKPPSPSIGRSTHPLSPSAAGSLLDEEELNEVASPPALARMQPLTNFLGALISLSSATDWCSSTKLPSAVRIHEESNKKSKRAVDVLIAPGSEEDILLVVE
jgi:hypothetical protein